jgi:hypothetical protein
MVKAVREELWNLSYIEKAAFVGGNLVKPI